MKEKAKKRKHYIINGSVEILPKRKETQQEVLDRIGYTSTTLNNCGISSW